MTLFHHRVSLLQSMTAVTTCNYPFILHAVPQLCIQYTYLEVDELFSITDSGRVGCVTTSRLGSMAVHEDGGLTHTVWILVLTSWLQQ